MTSRKKHTKNPWNGSGGFAGIPKFIMSSEDYLNLKGSELRLLMDAAFQFNGRNNGNLSFAYSDMKKRGFTSKATLERARKGLENKGFLEITRVGFAGVAGKRQCTLYALTYYPINDIPRVALDCEPTNKPSRGQRSWKNPTPITGVIKIK